MSVVVTDTGPPHYLALIGEIDLLPRLFGRLVMPEVVHAELCHSRAPALVREWIASEPAWLQVTPTPPVETLRYPRLDTGERAAIALATSIQADLLLMDDRAGVTTARAAGLTTVGTLGLLDLAARRGLVDLAVVLADLKATNFRARPELIDELLAIRRKSRPGT